LAEHRFGVVLAIAMTGSSLMMLAGSLALVIPAVQMHSEGAFPVALAVKLQGGLGLAEGQAAAGVAV
jgi:hypothetical protein